MNIVHKSNEKRREKIVSIILIIYVLLILEGAIRKWVFPGFSQYVFFIRVPVTLWLYFFIFRQGLWPRPHKYLVLGMVFAVVGMLLIPIQMLVGGYDFRYLLLAAYGWLNYFFYIPLAFIMAEHLRMSDLHRFVKITLVLAIIAAPLSVLQLFSHSSSPLIRGFGSGALQEFSGLGFSGGLIRPMGFFTSSIGAQMFIASVMAFVIAVWIIPNMRMQTSLLLRVSSAIAVMILVGVSIQRGALIHAGIVMLFAAIGGAVTLRRRIFLNSFLYPVLIIITGLAVFITMLPDAIDHFYTRWKGAAQTEAMYYGSLGLLSRVFYQITRFISILQEVPIVGFLLGIAGNAVSQLPWVEPPAPSLSWQGGAGWAEDGLSRNIVELGPIFGILFILYRFTFFFSLLQKAIIILRKVGDPLPIILVAFIMPLLLFYQMTGQGTITGYAWMFIGFTMVSIRQSKRIKLEKSIEK